MDKSGINVLIVDDSRFIAQKIAKVLSEDQDIGMVKKAHNGEEALDILEKFRPNCITLDVHMPGMNGLTVLKHIMIRCPTPTLMVSSYTSEGSWITFDALRYGAVDFYKKPSGDSPDALDVDKKVLCDKVRRAAKVRVQAARFIRLGQRCPEIDPCDRPDSSKKKGAFLFVGGTGGYASVLQLLSRTTLDPQREHYFFLDVPASCLEGFSRYVGASYGLKSFYYYNGTDVMRRRCSTLIFFNEIELLKNIDLKEWTVVALSGEGMLLDQFLAGFPIEKEQILALDPDVCLVPEMVENLISSGANTVSYNELAKLVR